MIKNILTFVLGLVIGLLIAFMFWQNSKMNALTQYVNQNAQNHAKLIQDLNVALNPTPKEAPITNQ